MMFSTSAPSILRLIVILCIIICLLASCVLRLLPVSSSDQNIDIFTKTFSPGRFHDLVSKLKMASVRSFRVLEGMLKYVYTVVIILV